MKVQFVSYDNLESIKANLKNDLPNYAKPNSDWLNDFFEGHLFCDTKFGEVKDFQLDMSAPAGKESSTDAANAELIYDHFRFLSDSQASDERLWAGLALGPFWNYVQYRWGIKEKPTVSNINEHVLFGNAVRRSLTRHAIARLWWAARLTYDKDRADPYELTKFVCSHSDIFMHVLERSFSNNSEVVVPFVSAMVDAQAKKLNVNTDLVGELAKYLNLLGGIYIIDCLPAEKIYAKTYDKIKELNSANCEYLERLTKVQAGLNAYFEEHPDTKLPALPYEDMKVGDFVRTSVHNLAQSEFIITDEQIQKLCDPETTSKYTYREKLGFLLPADAPLPEDGLKRYWHSANAKETFNTKEYYVFCDWYDDRKNGKARRADFMQLYLDIANGTL